MILPHQDPHTEIQIIDLHFRGPHGVYEHERAEGREFRLDARITLSHCFAHLSDDLSQTLDYSEICKILHQIGTTHSYHLIERLAEVMAQAILQFPIVSHVTLSVFKHVPHLAGLPPWVGVHIHRARPTHTPHVV